VEHTPRMSTQISSAVVNEQTINEYRETGLAVLRGVFSLAEIKAVSDEADRALQLTSLIDSNNLRCRWQNHYQTEECRFDCFDPIIDLSPTIERMARDQRVIDIVSSLYGEEACLFKDKLIYKPPGAKGYGLHQDYIGWDSFDPDRPCHRFQWSDRSFSRPAQARLSVRHGRRLPRTSTIVRRRDQRGQALSGTGRSSRLRWDAAAPVGRQRIQQLAPSVIPELQRQVGWR
jgi:hypothetical protein